MPGGIVLRQSGLFVALVGVGFIAGLLAGTLGTPSVEREPPPAERRPNKGHLHGRVLLSRQAASNLGLVTGPVELGDYYRMIFMPGEIIEAPGHSDHAVAAPVDGVVAALYVTAGQSIRPGDRLFDLRVADEALATAQVNLLKVLTQLEVVDAEMERLSPLAESGAVSGRRKLELEYEQKRLRAQKALHEQELLARGLDRGQIAAILETRQLLQTVQVSLAVSGRHTDHGEGGDLPGATSASRLVSRPAEASHEHWDYTVEELMAFPGKSVRRGDDLCHVAYHTMLYVRGEAFETDLPAVTDMERRGWTAIAELGPHGRGTTVEGLSILYVDNHVDSTSQTFHFYMPLRNSVVCDNIDEAGRVFRMWRFKPGMRLHVHLPAEKWEQRIVVPAGAIADEGFDAFVFRVTGYEHAHDAAGGHDEHGHADHLDDDHPGGAAEHEELEFERIPVRLLHRDGQKAVLDDGSTLRVGDRIALNQAYQLNLAVKRAALGGAGHDHDHD